MTPSPTSRSKSAAGRYFATRRTADGLRQAVERLERALAGDSPTTCAKYAHVLASCGRLEEARAFIYTNLRDGVTNLRLQPLDGGAARQLTNYAREIFYSFDIASDGRLLLANGLTTSDVVLFKDQP